MNTGVERPKLQVMVVCNRKGDLEVLTLRVKAPQGMILHFRRGQTQSLSPPMGVRHTLQLGKKRAVCRDEVTQQTQSQSQCVLAPSYAWLPESPPLHLALLSFRLYTTCICSLAEKTWLCCGSVGNSAACLIQIRDFPCCATIPLLF